jgi:hypothetical protein
LGSLGRKQAFDPIAIGSALDDHADYYGIETPTASFPEKQVTFIKNPLFEKELAYPVCDASGLGECPNPRGLYQHRL